MIKKGRLFNVGIKKKKDVKPKTYIGHRIFEATFSHLGSTKNITLHASNIMSDEGGVERYLKKYYRDCKIINIKEVTIDEGN